MLKKQMRFLLFNQKLKYKNHNSSKNLLLLSVLIFLNTTSNAYANISKNKNNLVSVSQNAPQTNQTQIESEFTKAFYKHTRPYHYNNDISSQIRNLFSISTGGTKQTDFIGIGFREKSIEWDGLAIESTYEKVMPTYFSNVKTHGSDIPSIFSTSLSSE
tara:strand:+ start:290 stop:766 length:477 start_codon:yes stop_codon:yes gene_type:complete